ncbi:hypothetical protein [Methylovulum psychrotolerans]|jgi:hypothetical protein|uniref:Uncharacterized protein n=1 Tax=Methylovulum psychrotolerans TaxID=1704499 RepID=A0A1Z4C445_9GAMM|nr:hypothetical protein [Methylovulum psychrotolerans]ASF48278.1 hypothetical protein CEK71_20650 [Methylovulum psychrotolerans]
MAKQKSIVVDVRSAVIQVSGSLYPVNQIAGIKSITVRPSSWWKRLFVKTRYAILMKTVGDGYFVLVVTLEEAKIEELFFKIRDAIDAQTSGNFTYVSEVRMTGDIVNQSGNFAVGFNKGEIDLSN